MPAPNRYDGWTLYQGSLWSEKTQYTYSDGTTRAMTSPTVTMEIRTRPFGTLIATPTISIDATNGIVSLTVLGSATSGLDFSVYNGTVWYDIFLTETGISRTCIQYGTMTAYAEVTQA